MREQQSQRNKKMTFQIQLAPSSPEQIHRERETSQLVAPEGYN